MCTFFHTRKSGLYFLTLPLKLNLHAKHFFEFMNTSIFNGFVKISLTWCSVLQWTSSTILFFTYSRIKWYFVSMCLLLLWDTGFFASDMTDLLSTYIVVGPSCVRSHSLKILFNQIAWHVHAAEAMYLASHVERAIVCFFLWWPLKYYCPNVKCISKSALSIIQVSI